LVFLLKNCSSPSIATQDLCEVVEDALFGHKPYQCSTSMNRGEAH